MTNAMSIIILIPGKYGGKEDNRYCRAIAEFTKKRTIPIERRYLPGYIKNPVNIFLYNRQMSHAVSGYLPYNELVKEAHEAANKMYGGQL